MIDEICPICTNKMQKTITEWHWACVKCQYEKANLLPVINTRSAHALINEADRENGLRSLRNENFEILIDEIKKIKPTGGKLLDVGCAHGWFLDIAKKDFAVVGVEPDVYISKSLAKHGVETRLGYFPDVLKSDEKFDVIIFNDVIEHIPNINNVLSQCKDRLNKQGLLVLNLPSSDGFFYRLSKALACLGKKDFFNRMWQKDLPSPHLHYLNNNNIVSVLNKNQFIVKKQGRLASLKLSGLYEKITFMGEQNKLSGFILYVLIALVLPALKMMPADIIYVMAVRE